MSAHTEKDPVAIRVLDINGERGHEAAETLRRFARKYGLKADIWSVGCMLEMARWGVTDKSPALLVDAYVVCSGVPLSERMLEKCVLGILNMQANG